MTLTECWILFTPLLVVGGCGSETITQADLSAADLSVPRDLAMTLSPDLSTSIMYSDGGLLNTGDGGAGACGNTATYTTRYVAGRTCSSNAGGQAGASCTLASDCAEVCCNCGNSSTNKYMAALCSDGHCNPAVACSCTDVPAALSANNICP